MFKKTISKLGFNQVQCFIRVKDPCKHFIESKWVVPCRVATTSRHFQSVDHASPCRGNFACPHLLPLAATLLPPPPAPFKCPGPRLLEHVSVELRKSSIGLVIPHLSLPQRRSTTSQRRPSPRPAAPGCTIPAIASDPD